MKVKEKTNCSDKERYHHEGYDGQQSLVGARGKADSEQVQEDDDAHDQSYPGDVGDGWKQPLEGQRRVDRVDYWDNQLIENHRPSYKGTDIRIQPAADVGAGGACGRIDGSHAAVAKCREHHGRHGDENGSREMAVRELLRDAAIPTGAIGWMSAIP